LRNASVVHLFVGDGRHPRQQLFERRTDDTGEFHRQRRTFQLMFRAAQRGKIFDGQALFGERSGLHVPPWCGQFL
jgi:hypothetical protein